MPSIYDLKPAFQATLRPLVRVLADRGVTPNQVTIAAFGLSLVCGLVVAIFPTWPPLYLLIPIALFLRMALNAIDGMLAREHNMVTPLGGYLNEGGDVLSDAALYLPLICVNGVVGLLVIVTVILSSTSELVGVVAKAQGGTRRYDGPMGKSDRAFVFGLIYLLIGLEVLPTWGANILVAAVCGLLVLTIRNRVISGIGEAKA